MQNQKFFLFLAESKYIFNNWYVEHQMKKRKMYGKQQ